MKRLLIIATLLLAAILLVMGVAGLFHAREPSYQGRSLTAWIDDYALQNQPRPVAMLYNPNKQMAFNTAFKEMGTNCVPFIFRRLERQDSPMQSHYRSTWPKLPKSLQRILPSPKPILEARSASMLVDAAGKPPLKTLLRAAKSPSSTLREVAVEGISHSVHHALTPNEADLVVIPEMIGLLKDPNKMVRLFAAGTLGNIGPKASNAVPALILALGDDDLGPTPGSQVAVRAWTVTALGRIGPDAATAIPALTDLMKGTDPMLRWKAAAAIWRIDSNVETTLPVLIQELPDKTEKWNLIDVLGEMGPQAKEAVPALERELKTTNSQSYINITNALVKIDPIAAAKLGLK